MVSGQDEYTPSVDEVREQYWMCTGDPRRGSKAWGEFDRWLEEHDREVVEKAFESFLSYRLLPDDVREYMTEYVKAGRES